jgi:tetratricopeptide (TPR) repeat protein
MEKGRLTPAALESAEAVRLDRGKPEYVILEANVLSRLKQNERAAELLAGIGRDPAGWPQEPSWLWLMSDTYQRLEQFDEVLKILDLIGRRSPADARVDLNRGQIYVMRTRFDLAVEAFRRSLEKAPAYAPAHFELGKLFYQRNEMEASRRALQEAVRLDPNQPEYLIKLGQACLALGRSDEAIEALTRAAGSGPKGPAAAQIYYALGTAYQRKGDQARAAEYRRKFQEVSAAQRKQEGQEQEISKLIAQGEKELDQGHDVAARTLFEQVVGLDPGNWDAHGYLAEMLLATADWRRAYPHLVRMEEVEPESVVGSYLMARYWYRSEEFGKARVYAEKVRLVRPGHAEARNLLGSIYAALGQNQEAAREFEAAVRLDPARADFRENLRKVDPRKPQ